MAVTWAFRCLVWGFVSASLTTNAIRVCLISDATWQWKVAAGIVAVLGALSTVVSFHISTLRCSETHTLKTLLRQYIFLEGLDLYTPFLLFKTKKVWKQPRKEQETFLRKLISRDVNTEYGKRYLRGIESLQDLRDKHPLTKYDHYQDYFQRLADGEKNVCVAGKMERFGISSGTTGKGKLIPLVSKGLEMLMFIAIPRILCKWSPVQKVAMLYCKPIQKFTRSGLPIAPALFVPDSSSAQTFLDAIQNSPFRAFQISTDFEATYIHLLFALTDKNICIFFAPFASQVYRAFTMLEDEQDQFIEDLAEGRVNPRLNIDEEIRRSLDATLKANPDRADELRREFSRGFVGIVGRIRPDMKFLLTVDISGYTKKLEAKYAKGIKLYTSLYGCTEVTIGINLWMDGRPPQYVPCANEVLVEFIPEDLRTGELLNLRSEKIDELVVTNAIHESLEKWPGATLVEWTCAESPLMYEKQDVKFDLFYLLFVELESEKDLILSAEELSLHEIYDHFRQVGTISEARVFVVRPGSFRKLQESIVATSTASYNQFKMPKKLRTKKTLDLMLESVADPHIHAGLLAIAYM